MTTKTLSDSDSVIHKPGKINLLARRMDAQNRLLAKKPQELSIIYALYGVAHGLSLSYSKINDRSDQHFTNSNLHSKWTMSPDEAVVALTAFPYIIILWPYYQDIKKGSKNVSR